MSLLIALLTAGALALATMAAARPVLRRLPLPTSSGTTVPWGHLPRPRWLAGLGLASALATGTGLLLAPAETAPLWLVWGGPVALLIAIDAATTWLPLSLTRFCGVALVVATVVAVAVGLPLHRVAIMAVSAGVAFALFWLLWRISGGAIGYGDVRLAALVGALAAAESANAALGAFIAGSLLGVAIGVVYRLGGHRGAFPYGPALWAGPWVFLLVQQGVDLLTQALIR